jgi:hypothetical protein
LLAVTLLSTAGLSQVLAPPKVARSVASAPLRPAELEWPAAAEPIELSIHDDVRKACSEFALPPEPYVFGSSPASDADAQALEGLAACLSQGPLRADEVELIGRTELPGRVQHESESPAAADVVRALLHRLGVPFPRLVTRDVPLDPFVSEHAAPRVVVVPAQEP